MSQIQDQVSVDFPLIAFQEDFGEFNSFYDTMRQLGFKQASENQQNHRLASYDEIMLFFVKVYALLAGILTAFYLMTFILLITKQSKLKENKEIDFHLVLYLVNLVITITVGFLAYFFEKSRQFPQNLICYLTFTCGAAYIFGDPLSDILQEGFYDGVDWIILLYLFTMTIGSYACLILFSFRRKTPLNSGCNSVVIYQVIIFSILGVMIFLLFIFIMTAPYYIGILITSFACHLIYGSLLIIDMKLIISGKFSLKINQYISGALYLYLDITVMMVYFIGCLLFALLKTIGQCLKVFCECCCKVMGGLKR